MKNNYWKTLLTNAGAALLSMLIPSRRRKPRAPAAAKRAKYDAIEELKKRMIANQELSARVYEATPEEAELLERLSAPTLRDLRGATKDLMAAIAAEPDSASPNGRHPQQAA